MNKEDSLINDLNCFKRILKRSSEMGREGGNFPKCFPELPVHELMWDLAPRQGPCIAKSS